MLSIWLLKISKRKKNNKSNIDSVTLANTGIRNILISDSGFHHATNQVPVLKTVILQ
jgi:hypothetical protein